MRGFKKNEENRSKAYYPKLAFGAILFNKNDNSKDPKKKTP